jgi:predicted transcriptional regulator YdeE
MKIVNLPNPIELCCASARSFPEGIVEAHDKIRALYPPAKDRTYFGLSRPENGVIVYKAAVEIRSGEAPAHPGIEKFVIAAGDYLSLTVTDFAKKPMAIGEAFQKIINEPGIDPQGYCLEWYQNTKDVLCLVKLA